MKNKRTRGYTLVELIIAVGLFALIMTLAAGAYLIMISITRQTQAIATGIDNVSFALDTMTRTIRTSTNYNCGGVGDCTGGTSFSVENSSGNTITYTDTGGAITQQIGSATPVALTDSTMINITGLTFYAIGTSPNDQTQSRVTIVISGTVASGPGKTVPFVVETGATMRGSDI